ncbi:MAG TPA: hypothetical protein PK263_02975 [bacterium]|nr:hypothetical protein [bacterium]
MKKIIAFLALALLTPTIAIAANTSTQNGNGNSGTAASTSSGQAASEPVTSSATTSQSEDNGSTSSTTTSQTQDRNQVQTQTNNPGVGTMTQEQLETRVQEQIQTSKPEYTPRNEQASARMSTVATAAEELIRVSNRVENQGIGEQIRTIAQTQTKNQDKINQSVDKAETRTGFAKFFIGANYKELKVAKQVMEENQEKIRELKTLIDQAATDADKLVIANQIMTLQEENLTLRDQIEKTDDGFSLFGWINRWFNKY